MLRILQFTVSCLLIGLTLASCSPDGTPTSVGSAGGKFPYTIQTVSPEWEDAGAWHNASLDTVMEYLDTNNPLSDAQITQNAWGLGLQAMDAIYSFDTTLIASVVIDTALAHCSTFLALPSSVGDNFVAGIGIVQANGPVYGMMQQEDKDLLDSISAFLTSYDTTGRTVTQMANDVITKCNSYLSIHTSQTWVDSLGGGEISGGALKVLIASSNYWKDFASGLPPAEQPEAEAFWAALIGADAAGYIIGWVGAVAVELTQNGKLDRGNERKRISAGVGVGVGASGGVAKKALGY